MIFSISFILMFSCPSRLPRGSQGTRHRNSIINNSERVATPPVGEHFRREGQIVADLVFCLVEKIYGGDFVRKSREKMYINKYQLIEHGLNRKL